MKHRALFVGLTTIDIQYFVNEFPASNRKIKTNPPDLFVGGPATNAAVAFAKLRQGLQKQIQGMLDDGFALQRHELFGHVGFHARSFAAGQQDKTDIGHVDGIAVGRRRRRSSN